MSAITRQPRFHSHDELLKQLKMDDEQFSKLKGRVQRPECCRELFPSSESLDHHLEKIGEALAQPDASLDINPLAAQPLNIHRLC